MNFGKETRNLHFFPKMRNYTVIDDKYTEEKCDLNNNKGKINVSLSLNLQVV